MGGSRSENNFVSKFCIKMLLNRLTCFFITICCLLTQLMNTSMNISIIITVVICNNINNLLWCLRRCCIIKIHQRFTIYFSVENRKIFPNFINIKCCILSSIFHYKSNPIFTPNLLAINLLIRFLSCGIFTLSSTLLANAYINNARASFSGIPLARK